MKRTFSIHWTSLAAAGALLTGAVQAIDKASPPPVPPAPRYRNVAAGVQLHHLSPVAYFRGLLGMTPAERERALANKSPSDRAIILAKVREYEALPRGIREARLCQTELHWELTALMKLAPRDRSNRLDEVSALYRPMIDNLLRQWDTVPAATQKALLEKQNFIGIYLRMQGSPAAAQQEILGQLSPERRAHWADEMNRWQAMPEKDRAELCAQFQHFCSLSSPEQKATVDAVPDADRQEMEKAMRVFDRLPPAQRTQCINSFRQFAVMAPGERNQFLKNAARWDAMTGHERQLWREMVHKLPPAPPGFPSDMPPMPPGIQEFTTPMPPMPPSVTAPVIIARAAR